MALLKSNCPVQIFRKMIKYLDLIQALGLPITSCTVSGDIKKKKKKAEKKSWKKKAEKKALKMTN